MAKIQRGKRGAASSPAKPLFIAAVRYGDGSRDLFRIEHADDLDDARTVLMEAVGNVRSALLAYSNKQRDPTR